MLSSLPFNFTVPSVDEMQSTLYFEAYKEDSTKIFWQVRFLTYVIEHKFTYYVPTLKVLLHTLLGYIY